MHAKQETLNFPFCFKEVGNICDLPQRHADQHNGLDNGPERDFGINALQRARVNIFALVHVRLVILQ